MRRGEKEDDEVGELIVGLKKGCSLMLAVASGDGCMKAVTRTSYCR